MGYQGRHSIWPSRRGGDSKRNGRSKERMAVAGKEDFSLPCPSDVGLSLDGRTKKEIQVSLSVHYKIFDVTVPDLWKDRE